MHKATSYMQNIAVYSLLWHFAGREICNKKLWKVDSPPFRSTPPHKPKNKKVLPVPRPPLLMLFLAKEEEALIWILLLRMLLFRRKSINSIFISQGCNNWPAAALLMLQQSYLFLYTLSVLKGTNILGSQGIIFEFFYIVSSSSVIEKALHSSG